MESRLFVTRAQGRRRILEFLNNVEGNKAVHVSAIASAVYQIEGVVTMSHASQCLRIIKQLVSAGLLDCCQVKYMNKSGHRTYTWGYKITCKGSEYLEGMR